MPTPPTVAFGLGPPKPFSPSSADATVRLQLECRRVCTLGCSAEAVLGWNDRRRPVEIGAEEVQDREKPTSILSLCLYSLFLPLSVSEFNEMVVFCMEGRGKEETVDRGGVHLPTSLRSAPVPVPVPGCACSL
jgi:hypothetical protein